MMSASIKRLKLNASTRKDMRVAELLTPQEVAEELAVPVSTIYRWNYTRTGPPPCRVGKHVRYRREDVDRWIESRVDDPDRAA
jgi:excisionase family DNA binding protein